MIISASEQDFSGQCALEFALWDFILRDLRPFGKEYFSWFLRFDSQPCCHMLYIYSPS